MVIGEHETVGPSPEWQRKQWQQDLSRDAEAIAAAIGRRRESEQQFDDKYGELGALTRVYFEGWKRPVVPGLVQRDGKYIPIDEVRLDFATVLATQISTIPEAERAHWLNEFFADINRLY